MGQWAVIIPADRWADERLFHHDTVTVSAGATAVAADDEVLLVADGNVVALARAAKPHGDELVLTYLRRSFDNPLPAPTLTDGEITPVDPETFRRFATALGADPTGPHRPTWLVSVALPIEATTPAEAVRQFWSHVLELGPAELPTYVWPSGDELAMQAFVLGAEANQDPEEEDED
ncbi:hypothetical protein [Actinoplanes sp. NPDC048796]|uniref:hypothetical protein n=1 Tax=Actinoplanes sp. NPDC048796 TaxID=3155640 RepID=UPI0033C5FC7B